MVSTEATPLSTSNKDIHNPPPPVEEGKPGMGEHRQPPDSNRRNYLRKPRRQRSPVNHAMFAFTAYEPFGAVVGLITSQNATAPKPLSLCW